jgi:DnaJ-class molecular chaperone
MNETITCPACGGSAWDSKGNACKECKGNGTVNR